MPQPKTSPRSKRSNNGPLGQPRGKVPTEQRLEEIFQVSAAEFQERGFRAARLHDIADKLGVTRAALYYYFKSKDDLIEFVCGHNMDLAEAALRVAQELDDPVDRLRDFSHRYAPVIIADAAIVTLRERGELRAAFRRRLMARAQAITTGTEQLVSDCVAAGRFREDIDVPLAALALLGMLNGCSQWYRSSSPPLDTIVDAFLAIFLDGVTVNAPATAKSGRKPARV